MTYDTVVLLSQTSMLLFFIVFFLAILAYACWPSNKAKFDHAARIPLQRDEDTDLNRGLS